MAVIKRAIIEYVFSCDCKCGKTETVKVEYNAENERGKHKPTAPRSWITLQFNDIYKIFYGPWCVINYINSFWMLRIDDATMRKMQENHHNKVTSPAVSSKVITS